MRTLKALLLLALLLPAAGCKYLHGGEPGAENADLPR